MEKPPGYCLSDAKAIASAAQARGGRVFVALNRRFLSSTMRVQKELAESEGPRFIKVQDQEIQAHGYDLGKPPEVIANWMFANAIHTIDYFRVFGRGAVKRVTPVAPWNPADPGVVIVRIDFDSGDLGLYEGIWHAPGPWAISVTVPGRRWEMRPLEQLETQLLGQRTERHDCLAWDREYKPGFRAQAEHAVAAALGRPSALIPLDDALKTVELIAAMFQVDGA
jgi:predicted dehydrogenase